MGKSKVETPAGRTPDQDVAAINALELDQVWLYALVLAVRPGSRIVSPEAVCTRLGISPEDATSILGLLGHCVTSISSRAFAPANMLRTLMDLGVEIERATLLVDVATAYTDYGIDPVAAILGRLESIEQAVKPTGT